METQIDYDSFVKLLDIKLEGYFRDYYKSVSCKKGCSDCCEQGDYPLSDIELRYLMQGYMQLDNDTKILIQENFRKMEKGGKCPFLIDKTCSIYPYRPIICRVHGLAYLCKDSTVKLPHCAECGKCYSEEYSNGEFKGNPIKENLDTGVLLEKFNPVIKNLYDWIKEIQ